jgi:dTDP-4-amino-4,6-dideoxygalactose transaminase
MSLHVDVPLLVPDLPDRNDLWPYLERIDHAKQYSNFGPLVRELEAELHSDFAVHSSRPVYVTTVSSATLGLELALAALDLPAGSRVMVPALTFVATATAVIRAGHIPVVADIDPERWCLTPAIAAEAMRTTPCQAVMPVAVFGHAASLAAWNEFERKHGVPVIVDAAAAFGTQWLDGAQGTLVFSMHTTKSLPAGEGGLVVSTNADLIKRVRQCSNFGINLDASVGVPPGALNLVGTNAKLSEYHAAVGLASLARWQERALSRRQLMQRFRAVLSTEFGGPLVWPDAPRPAAPTLMCVRWPGRGNAQRLEQNCAALGVATRRWYQPMLHRHPLPAAMMQRLPTPIADALAPELIGLPFFPGMSDAQFDTVCEAVENARPPARATRETSSSHSSSPNAETLPHGHA